jgi:hypothetical protein
MLEYINLSCFYMKCTYLAIDFSCEHVHVQSILVVLISFQLNFNCAKEIVWIRFSYWCHNCRYIQLWMCCVIQRPIRKNYLSFFSCYTWWISWKEKKEKENKAKCFKKWNVCKNKHFVFWNIYLLVDVKFLSITWPFQIN